MTMTMMMIDQQRGDGHHGSFGLPFQHRTLSFPFFFLARRQRMHRPAHGRGRGVQRRWRALVRMLLLVSRCINGRLLESILLTSLWRRWGRRGGVGVGSNKRNRIRRDQRGGSRREGKRGGWKRENVERRRKGKERRKRGSIVRGHIRKWRSLSITNCRRRWRGRFSFLEVREGEVVVSVGCNFTHSPKHRRMKGTNSSQRMNCFLSRSSAFQ